MRDNNKIGVLVDDATDRKSSEKSEPPVELEKLTTLLEAL